MLQVYLNHVYDSRKDFLEVHCVSLPRVVHLRYYMQYTMPVLFVLIMSLYVPLPLELSYATYRLITNRQLVAVRHIDFTLLPVDSLMQLNPNAKSKYTPCYRQKD